MNESSPVVLDSEAPVNPYSLLEAVNRSSRSASAAWLLYVALMGYLLVTIAGVSHKDLLLDNDVALPLLQAKIPLTRFFLWAPFLLLLVHMGIIAELALTARKALEFSAAVRLLEASDRRTHPLRLELDNVFFVQALAGPERSRVIGFLLHAMSWLTLVAMPLLLLLSMQVLFLPYHDAAITALNRAAVLLDVLLLLLLGAFLWRLETSLPRAFLRMGRQHPVGLALTALLLFAGASFSLLVATVPDRGPAVGSALAAGREAHGGDPQLGRVPPLLGEGVISGLLLRNLVVSDADLEAGRPVRADARAINLRGRDLRNAKLDRSDLRQADMTGADLAGASLRETDLRGAWIGCADLEALLLGKGRALAACASARGADLSGARLSEAKMAGLDLTGARMSEADLAGARLAKAQLGGANLTGARLDGADLSGASLLGARLPLASLVGADLSGAKLEFADLTGAVLQGTDLSRSGLEGARLQDAQLEGANLQLSKMYGTQLAGAKLQGSDLSGAVVWRASPPAGEVAASADLSQLNLRPPTEAELAALAALLLGLDGAALQGPLGDARAALMDAPRNAGWANSGEQQQWQGLVRGSDAALDGYKNRLTELLGRLMCRSRMAGGALASGIARRALEPGFKGDPGAIYNKLRSADCPAGQSVTQGVLRELAARSEQLGAP